MAMTLHLWLAGWKAELATYAMHLPDQTIVQNFFYEHHKGQIKYPQIDFNISGENVRSHVLEGLKNLTLYPNARDVLLGIVARGVQVALVTSSSRDLIEKGLGLHEIDQHFLSIVAGDDGFGHKPSPLPFQETLKRLDANPQTTLVIGDAAPDILAARAVQCQSCLFIPDENALFQDREYLTSLSPDYMIQSLSGLVDLV